MTKRDTSKLLRAASLIEAHLEAHKGQFSDGAFCLPVVMLEAAAMEIRAVLGGGAA